MKALRTIAPILSRVLSAVCVFLVAYGYMLMFYELAPRYPL